jgi:hypothetical protein
MLSSTPTTVGLLLIAVSGTFAYVCYFHAISDVLLTCPQLLAVIIYRLKFHPLAKYPGPLLAKITSLSAVYHVYKGDRHIHIHRAHEKYGM